jgi:hypothetical protein
VEAWTLRQKTLSLASTLIDSCPLLEMTLLQLANATVVLENNMV